MYSSVERIDIQYFPINADTSHVELGTLLNKLEPSKGNFFNIETCFLQFRLYIQMVRMVRAIFYSWKILVRLS